MLNLILRPLMISQARSKFTPYQIQTGHYPRVCSSGSHFVILHEFVRTSLELPLNPNGTELGAKSENGTAMNVLL